MFDSIFYCGMVGTSTGKDSKVNTHEMIEAFQEIMDDQSGATCVVALTTVLKLALETAPEEARFQLIDNIVTYMKEIDYATQ